MATMLGAARLANASVSTVPYTQRDAQPVSNATQTIPVALASLQGDRMMDATTINAGSLISLLPAVIFFFIFQRTLTRGVTAGAVK